MATTPEKIAEAYVEIGGRDTALRSALDRAQSLTNEAMNRMGATSGRIGLGITTAITSASAAVLNLGRTFGDIEDTIATVMRLMGQIGEGPESFRELVGTIRQLAPALNVSSESLLRLMVPLKQYYVLNRDIAGFLVQMRGAQFMTGGQVPAEQMAERLLQFRLHGGSSEGLGIKGLEAKGFQFREVQQQVLRQLEEAGRGQMAIESRGVAGSIRSMGAGLKELYDGVEELVGEAAIAYDVPQKLRDVASRLRDLGMGMRGFSNLAETHFEGLGNLAQTGFAGAYGMTPDEMRAGGRHGMFMGGGMGLRDPAMMDAMLRASSKQSEKDKFDNAMEIAKTHFRESWLPVLTDLFVEAVEKAKAGFHLAGTWIAEGLWEALKGGASKAHEAAVEWTANKLQPFVSGGRFSMVDAVRGALPGNAGANLGTVLAPAVNTAVTSPGRTFLDVLGMGFGFTPGSVPHADSSTAIPLLEKIEQNTRGIGRMN